MNSFLEALRRHGGLKYLQPHAQRYRRKPKLPSYPLTTEELESAINGGPHATDARTMRQLSEYESNKVRQVNLKHAHEEYIRGVMESDFPLMDAAKKNLRRLGATDADIERSHQEAVRRHDAKTASFNQGIRRRRERIAASAPTITRCDPHTAGIIVEWRRHPRAQLVEDYRLLYRHASKRGEPNGGWTQWREPKTNPRDFSYVINHGLTPGETYDVTVEAGCRYGSVQAEPITVVIPGQT